MALGLGDTLHSEGCVERAGAWMHGTGEPLGRWSSEVPAEAKSAAKAVARVLQTAQKVLVLGHAGADGDVAGSSLGLAVALRELGKEVTVYNERPLKEAFAWLPEADTLVTSLPADARFDVTVVVDAADPARCGSDVPGKGRRGTFVWIDHHRIDTPPGDVNYIDLTAAAVGEQIAEVLAVLEHPLSLPVSKALYCSLMSDTGGFRYGNASARAFRLAGDLVAAGVDPWEMTERLYESQAEERVRLLARALSTLWRSACGRVGVVVVRDEDMEASRAVEEHVHGIVNHVRGIRGVEVAVLLRERADGTRVVIRSRGNVPVSRIAERFSATGHMNSASFVLAERADKAWQRVVDAATAVAGETLQERSGANPRSPARRRVRRRRGGPSSSSTPAAQ
jgi:bifunctional oligoribonuclease and PAP phosphatase NrnA